MTVHWCSFWVYEAGTLAVIDIYQYMGGLECLGGCPGLDWAATVCISRDIWCDSRGCHCLYKQQA